MANEQRPEKNETASARDAGTERLVHETAEPMTNPAMRWEASRNGTPGAADTARSPGSSPDDSETDATP